MSDFKAKLRTRLFRRASQPAPASTTTSAATSATTSPASSASPTATTTTTLSQQLLQLQQSQRPKPSTKSDPALASAVSEEQHQVQASSRSGTDLLELAKRAADDDLPPPPRSPSKAAAEVTTADEGRKTECPSFFSAKSVCSLGGQQQQQDDEDCGAGLSPSEHQSAEDQQLQRRAGTPELVLETPGHAKSPITVESPPEVELDRHTELPARGKFGPVGLSRGHEPFKPRKQSLVDSANVHIIQTLLQGDTSILGGGEVDQQLRAYGLGLDQQNQRPESSAASRLLPSMLQRKVWVKRPGASATLVQVREDDLVDDVRDHILRKYGNSLGRSFDAPDLTIKIVARAEKGEKHVERVLGPEEEMCRTIDQMFPGGQTVDDALIIDIPYRRTPKPSPRAHYAHYQEETARPLENGGDYFPPMPPAAASSPGNLTTASHHSSVHGGGAGGHEHTRAMSVLNTGQVPPLPSPGGGSRRAHHRSSRPGYVRQHTSSPTALTAPNSVLGGGIKGRPRLDSSASEQQHGRTTNGAGPPLPSPGAQNHDGSVIAPTGGLVNASLPTTPRVSSPAPGKRFKKSRNKPSQQQQQQDQPGPTIPMTLGLDTSVPPINVLIVEDNHINLKLLEQFIRRLKVRWATAVNGREAVNKWREGGFHLVLMDIQLPIMSGLEATKEIRRLERVNGIGVFSSTSSASSEAPNLLRAATQQEDKETEEKEEEVAKAEDKLDAQRLFKSPVIIVALTASALQSDRHEALTAGCNDFLTKPVNFVWFERKVKEWGCMQALIDFDGWRKWKDFADTPPTTKINGASASNKFNKSGGGGGAPGPKKGPPSAVGGAGKPSAVAHSAAAAQMGGDWSAESAGEGSRDESSSS